MKIVTPNSTCTKKEKFDRGMNCTGKKRKIRNRKSGEMESRKSLGIGNGWFDRGIRDSEKISATYVAGTPNSNLKRTKSKVNTAVKKENLLKPTPSGVISKLSVV